MEKEKIIRVLKEAMQGSRRVQITIRPAATDVISHLLEMEKIIKIDEEVLIMLLDVRGNAEWIDENRNVVIFLDGKFDDSEWFANLMWHALEDIKTVA